LASVFADDHPTALAAMVNHAISGRSIADGPKELAALDHAARRCQQVLGESHPYTAAVRLGVRIDVDIEVEPT